MSHKNEIVVSLNALLSKELLSIDQYFAHAHMYRHWGYEKLFEKIDHERQDEIHHAQQLIERILFLDGIPHVSKCESPNIGGDVPSMLKNDLETEYRVAELLYRVIQQCEEKQDYVSRTVLLNLLRDTEEDHIAWLEKQLHLIEALGLENYLQCQMGANVSS